MTQALSWNPVLSKDDHTNSTIRIVTEKTIILDISEDLGTRPRPLASGAVAPIWQMVFCKKGTETRLFFCNSDMHANGRSEAPISMEIE